MSKNTEYTKKLKTTSIILSILSYVLCFGIAIFFIVQLLAGHTPAETSILDNVSSFAATTAITVIIMLILSIVVKDKICPTVWMINVILAGTVYGLTACYIVFAIWFLDTYAVKPLKNRYKQRYIVNKEIDKRETE